MDPYYENENQEKRKRFLLYAALGVAFLLACVAVGFFLFPAEEPAEDVTGEIIYDLDAVSGGWESLSEEEIVASLNEKVEEGYVNISMNASPVFADGQSEGNLMLVNEAVNRYPQQVVITRQDTGEAIYTSHAIPVGSNRRGYPGRGPARRDLRVYRHVPLPGPGHRRHPGLRRGQHCHHHPAITANLLKMTKENDL